MSPTPIKGAANGGMMPPRPIAFRTWIEGGRGMIDLRVLSYRVGQAGRRFLALPVRASFPTNIPGHSETIAPDRLTPGRGRPGLEYSPEAVETRRCSRRSRERRPISPEEPARGRRAAIDRVF